MKKFNCETEISIHEIIKKSLSIIAIEAEEGNDSIELILNGTCILLIEKLVDEVEKLKQNALKINIKEDKNISLEDCVTTSEYIEYFLRSQGKALTVNEIIKGLFKLGFKINSTSPYSVVRSVLDRGKKRFFKIKNTWYVK